MDIETWVGKNCKALQPPLDTAEVAVKDVGNISEEWLCPNCSVKIRARKRALGMGYGLRLDNAEKCKEIPPLDENLI